MTSDDDGPLSDVDRRSIRILARSTKAAGPSKARIAERLEKAAGSGNRTDYRRAEESFDSLPPRERRRIGTHAERQAETERQLQQSQKDQPEVPKVAAPPVPAVDDTLDWKPLILDHSPATDGAGSPSWALAPERKPAANTVPPVPKPAAGRPKAPEAGSRLPDRAAPPAAPPKSPAITLESDDAHPSEDEDKGWDWQRIPDDPILKARRKKPASLDPIEQLRREMLGDDLKRR